MLRSARDPLPAREISAQLVDASDVVIRFALGDLLHAGEIEMKSAPSPSGAELVYWLRDRSRPASRS